MDLIHYASSLNVHSVCVTSHDIIVSPYMLTQRDIEQALTLNITCSVTVPYIMISFCLPTQADVYVNTTSASLDLSNGAVAQSLLKAGGPALQDECTKYNRANGDVAVWNIATTGGAGLKCKHVIHTVGSQYDGAASQQVKVDLRLYCAFHSLVICVAHINDILYVLASHVMSA